MMLKGILVGKMKVRRLKIFSRSLFVIYLLVTLYLMLFSEEMGRTIDSENYRYNLIPFKEIHRFLKYSERLGASAVLINILGNVLCFIPLGFFLPILTRRLRSFLLVTILALTFSFTIEIVQLLFKVGSFDVDDLLMNTLGGIIGYLFFAVYDKFFKSKGDGNEKS